MGGDSAPRLGVHWTETRDAVKLCSEQDIPPPHTHTHTHTAKNDLTPDSNSGENPS